MRTRIVAVLATALAAALAPGGGSQLAKALASQPAKQRLLYQTNWRHGKLGWLSVENGQSNGRWVVVGGELTYGRVGDLFTQSTLVAPYTVRAPNYAVEATIQGLQYGYNPPSLLGVVGRGSTHGPGIGAGVYIRGMGATAADAKAGIYEFVSGGGAIGQTDFDPGRNWHNYRLEVRANHYRLLIDGQFAASGVSNYTLSGHRVGLTVGNWSINVSVFKVFAL